MKKIVVPMRFNQLWNDDSNESALILVLQFDYVIDDGLNDESVGRRQHNELGNGFTGFLRGLLNASAPILQQFISTVHLFVLFRLHVNGLNVGRNGKRE